MKKVLFISIILFTLLQGAEPFVIGYVPSYRISYLNQMNLKSLTHVIAAFSNPDSSGDITSPFDMDSFSKAVRAAGSNPVASIGGGGSYSWGADTTIYSHLYADTNRAAFISKLISYVKQYNLSGIDVDIEGTALMNDNYNIFTQDLADSLHNNGLEIYSAYGVGAYAGAGYATDETLLKFDIIGTMSYGGVDNWNWDKPEHQATLDRFKSDIKYFTDRGVLPSHIAGGVPFYSAGFPKEKPANYSPYYHTWAQFYLDSFYIAQDPFYNDTLINKDSMPEYCNSFPTMKEKIDYAKSIGSGIMIWELGQDDYSGNGPNMLDSMALYISPGTTGISTINKSTNIKKSLNVVHLGKGFQITSPTVGSIKIVSLSGRIVETHSGFKSGIIGNNLRTGIYLLKFNSLDGISLNRKMIVK